MDAPSRPGDGGSPRRRLRRFLDEAYRRADHVLDRGQHHAFRLLWAFLPEPKIGRDPHVQQLIASRFFSEAGQQALTYGVLIAVVRDGGSALDAALVGIAGLIAPALLGMYGGAVADALPKRIALALAYNLQAGLCLLVVFFLGTDLLPVLLLIFGVSAIGQVSGPAESSVLPFVASKDELASAAAMIDLVSSVGTAVGTALLAPVLVLAFGVEPVIYVAAALLFLAASRAFDLPLWRKPRAVDWRKPDLKVRSTLLWLIRQQAVITMILLAVLAASAAIVLQTLGPRYVQSALGADPTQSVYVFGPTAGGLLVALLSAQAMIRRLGERRPAILGFLLVSTSLVLMGLVATISDVIDPVNPIRVLDLFGADLGERLRTAALLALPLGYGLALSKISVQTYINRRLPVAYQSRAFALQNSLKHGLAIVPLLVLGGAATTFGVERVLVISPFALLGLAAVLVYLSYRFGGEEFSGTLDVLSTFWQEDDLEIVPPAEG